MPDWLHFFQNTFPSANSVLARGNRPILIDTGFGSDAPVIERLLRTVEAPPDLMIFYCS